MSRPQVWAFRTLDDGDGEDRLHLWIGMTEAHLAWYARRQGNRFIRYEDGSNECARCMEGRAGVLVTVSLPVIELHRMERRLDYVACCRGVRMPYQYWLCPHCDMPLSATRTAVIRYPADERVAVTCVHEPYST